MKSRMEKYYDGEVFTGKRTERNETLYKEVNKSELEDFKVNSNVKILDSHVNDININELKSMIDQKYYNQTPKRKSIFIEPEEPKKQDLEMETKEYDINSILNKAREEKEFDYEEERLKKINNTQFDILKNLNFVQTKTKEDNTETEETLMTLINTITARELEQTSKLNPLDILTDLKGNDNTITIPAQKEEKDVLEDTMSIDKSFYTTKSNFDDEDFDDFKDLSNDNGGSKTLISILITIAIIALMIGILIIVNNYFNLGLF